MAGRVFTVAQQKGGAGKTTLAAHLAVAWRQQGHSVALVDIDPQGSLSRWMAARTAALNGAPGLTHVQVSGWRTQNEVDRLRRQHDMVLIDGPPHAETEARIAVRAADLVLVPIQPSPMDVWATQPTLDLARGEQRSVLLVLNRVPPRARLAETLVAQIRALGAEVATTAIGNRIQYAGALMDGRSVTESARRSRAAEEITALVAEILARTG